MILQAYQVGVEWVNKISFWQEEVLGKFLLWATEGDKLK